MMDGLPAELHIGLKEWAAVCSAMADGRQILLLRKGGIHESGGRFELEHPQFVFFPTYLHQDPQMVKPQEQARVQRLSAEPAQVQLSLAGQVTDILRLESRRQMDLLEDLHIWAPALIDMRYNYRPDNPLYLLLVRACRLPGPLTIQNTPEYAGCRSWVPFDRPVSTAGAVPALSQADFEDCRSRIHERLGLAR
jgi:hypothetical protein